MRITLRRLFPVLLLTLLAACGSPPTPPSDMPTGPEPVTVQGFVRPIQVRVYDAGTHLLVNRAGEPLYVLASSAVDLGAHVGEEVEVSGITTRLSGGNDLLLSVRELRTIASGSGDREAIDAARRLAAEHTPPYVFPSTDRAEVVSSSAATGITVVRFHQELATYLVRLVRKPDPVTGAWEVFSIEKEAEFLSSVPPSSLPSEVPSSVPPAAVGDAATVASLVAALPTVLEGGELTAPFRATKVELSEQRRGYVTFEHADGRGMVLLGWTTAEAPRVLATFVPGDTTDWKRSTGDNVARDDALTVYALESGAWAPQTTTKAGFAVYTSTTHQFRLQYPKQWYYASLGRGETSIARIGFAPSPVTAEVAVLTVEIVPGTPSTYATKLEPVSINGQAGYRGVLNVGTETVVLPRDGTTSFLLTKQSGAAVDLLAIAETLVSTK